MIIVYHIFLFYYFSFFLECSLFVKIFKNTPWMLIKQIRVACHSFYFYLETKIYFTTKDISFLFLDYFPLLSLIDGRILNHDFYHLYVSNRSIRVLKVHGIRERIMLYQCTFVPVLFHLLHDFFWMTWWHIFSYSLW